MWESYKLDPYVQKLAEVVSVFQEKVDDLLMAEEQIDVEVCTLESCAYGYHVLLDILVRVQKLVDDLSLHQYSNLPQWVAKLDAQVEEKLARRLEAGLKGYTNHIPPLY